MARVLRAVGAAMAALGLLGAGLARPAYRETAIRQLHLPGSVWSKKTMACTYCHQTDQGGPSWNVFGETLKAGFRAEPRANFGEVLYGVLKANADTDGDGYGDALEVFARTLPGDPGSRPTEEPAELVRRFEAAGGVEQYRPVKSRR